MVGHGFRACSFEKKVNKLDFHIFGSNKQKNENDKNSYRNIQTATKQVNKHKQLENNYTQLKTNYTKLQTTTKQCTNKSDGGKQIKNVFG